MPHQYGREDDAQTALISTDNKLDFFDGNALRQKGELDIIRQEL